MAKEIDYDALAGELGGVADDAPVAGSAASRATRGGSPLYLEALPVAGGALGALGGAGLASIPLAAAGSAGGEALKQYLARQMGYDAPEGGAAVRDIVMSGAFGAIGGPVMKGAGAAGRAIANRTPDVMSELALRILKRRIPGLSTAEDLAELAGREGEGVGGALKRMWSERGGKFRPGFGPEVAPEELIAQRLSQVPRGAGGMERAAQRMGSARARLAAETPEVAGEIVPAAKAGGKPSVRKPVRPKKAKAGTAKPEKGTAASRVAEEPSRHEVQYYSESRGKFIPIETMHIAQLKNAMNKLGRRLAESPRPGKVTRKQFEALRDEVTYRAQQAGELSVY